MKIRKAGLLWQTTNADRSLGRKRQSMVVKLYEQSMAPSSTLRSAEKVAKRSRRNVAHSFMPRLVRRVVSPPNASKARNFTPRLVKRAVSAVALRSQRPLLRKRSRVYGSEVSDCTTKHPTSYANS